MSKNEPSLIPFFAPQGIVLVGASQNPVKLGYGLARNLVHSNYQGAVHFVNPNGGSLFGRTIYTSLAQVPDPVDLAILLIPAAAVPAALDECGQRGLRAAIIGSGGFRETGQAGAELEQDCLRVAASYNMRLLGPNSIGLLDTHLPVDATFLPPPGPLPGDVAFISHSGAICAAVIDWARGQGFGLSRLVSLGNQVDVNETDVLGAVAKDSYTRVLTLYLEGVSDGRRFVEQAGRVARQKPVIALKVGRYASGQQAVASHTGALAGQESAFNAAFRRAGVIRADTSEEMFDWARALAWSPLPQGRSMAVLTNAGGPGVTAADALEANGLSLAQLQDETSAWLRAILPPAASLKNPVDMLASATPEQYAQCLGILLADPGVHGVLVILPPPPTHTAGAVAKGADPRHPCYQQTGRDCTDGRTADPGGGGALPCSPHPGIPFSRTLSFFPGGPGRTGRFPEPQPGDAEQHQPDLPPERPPPAASLALQQEAAVEWISAASCCARAGRHLRHLHTAIRHCQIAG